MQKAYFLSAIIDPHVINCRFVRDNQNGAEWKLWMFTMTK
jgi:hypothetical protein